MELQSKNYTKALDIFQDCKNHLCIHGVIRGLIPGRIFMADDSATAMVASTEGIYLGGNPDNDLFLREMNSLLRHEIFPKLDTDDVLDYVVYYPQSPLWEAKMDIVMKDLYAMKSGRMTFSHDLGNTDAPLPTVSSLWIKSCWHARIASVWTTFWRKSRTNGLRWRHF